MATAAADGPASPPTPRPGAALRRILGLAVLLAGGYGVAVALGFGPPALGGREGLLLAVPCLAVGALLLVLSRPTTLARPNSGAVPGSGPEEWTNDRLDGGPTGHLPPLEPG